MQKRPMAPSPARLGPPGPCTAVVPPPKSTLRARWIRRTTMLLPTPAPARYPHAVRADW